MTFGALDELHVTLVLLSITLALGAEVDKNPLPPDTGPLCHLGCHINLLQIVPSTHLLTSINRRMNRRVSYTLGDTEKDQI